MREQLLEHERQRPVHTRMHCRRCACVCYRVCYKEKKFHAARNEYVPMTRKIITTIIWMQRESNETEFHFDFEHLIKQIRPIARLLNCPRTACALPSVVITLDIEQCFPLNATFISLHSLKGIGSTSLSKMKHFSFN